MKRVLVATSILIVLSSCEHTPQEQPMYREHDRSTNFRTVLSGGWINAEYLNELPQTTGTGIPDTQTPAFALTEIILSQSTETEVLTGKARIVTPATITNYTLTVSARGGLTPTSYPVTLQPALTDSLHRETRQEISYEIKGADTLLFLNSYTKDRVLATRQRFIKIPQTAASPITYALMRQLSGTYHQTNDTGKAQPVQLTRDGYMSGLGHNWQRYVLSESISEKTGIPHYITLIGDSSQQQLVYEMSGDTLLLYEVEKFPDDSAHRKTSLKHTLVKEYN
ncbi:MAG: hypothetical protein JNL72_15005 [Flavipsychrobacter sp.]|nr:hypothetical protein [Flavipsychrobacter sp.]